MYVFNISGAAKVSGTPGPFDGPQWPHLAPRSIYMSAAVFMGMMVISASFVNGLVIIVSIRYKKLRSPLNYILVNLAVADLLVTLSGSTVSFSSNISGFFMLGKKLCEFEGFMVSVTGLRTSCGPNWYAGGSNNNSYITALFVTCFVLPLSMILFSYTNLLVMLRAVAARQKGSATTQQAEREVTQMVIATVLAFLTSWLPYATFAMVVATKTSPSTQLQHHSLPTSPKQAEFTIQSSISS